jgi:hypothetical protein
LPFHASLHVILIAGVFSFLAAKALLQFSTVYDVLNFHLPRALALLHRTTYIMSDDLLLRDAGFPALAHRVMALLIALTGRISAANLVNLAGFALACAAIALLFRSRFSLRWFLTFCLAVPLFWFHTTVALNDLFTASMVLIAFAGLTGLLTDRPPLSSALLMIAGAAAAMDAKMQAWVPVAVLSAAGTAAIVFAVRESRITRTRGALLVALFFVLVSFFPLRNTLLFHNPTYPITFPFYQHLPSREDLPRDVPAAYAGLPAPAVFALSVFEINRDLTSAPYHYSIDQSDDDTPIHNLMGGWAYWTVILTLLLLICGTVRGLVPRGPVTVFALMTIACAFVPEFFILRYCLFLPLIAFFLLSLSLDRYPAIPQMIGKAAFVSFACIAAGLMAPDFWTIDMRPPSAFAPDEARISWHSHPDCTEKYPCIIDRTPNTIFWSGPLFNQIPVKQRTPKQ